MRRKRIDLSHINKKKVLVRNNIEKQRMERRKKKIWIKHTKINYTQVIAYPSRVEMVRSDQEKKDVKKRRSNEWNKKSETSDVNIQTSERKKYSQWGTKNWKKIMSIFILQVKSCFNKSGTISWSPDEATQYIGRHTVLRFTTQNKNQFLSKYCMIYYFNYCRRLAT